jgi:hypothetical protein
VLDENLIGHGTNEGVDDIGVGDVGELIALLGETLDVLLECLIGPLPVVIGSHEFPSQVYVP